jgi:hypothetical protein
MDPTPTLFGLLVSFLMTPFLVAVISGSAPTTVGSDMVFATLTKFTGSIQHYRQQSVNLEGSTLTMRVSQMQRTLHRLLSTSSRFEIGRSCKISMPKEPYRTGDHHDSRSLRSHEALRVGGQVGTGDGTRTGKTRWASR